jgi:hypothetical protein
VHFLSSAEAGDRWLVGHPSGFVLSIEEGFHLGRLTNDAAFGVALGREGA